MVPSRATEGLNVGSLSAATTRLAQRITRLPEQIYRCILPTDHRCSGTPLPAPGSNAIDLLSLISFTDCVHNCYCLVPQPCGAACSQSCLQCAYQTEGLVEFLQCKYQKDVAASSLTTALERISHVVTRTQASVALAIDETDAPITET